ncbi:MAG: lysine--tRNA ligase [Planctomycetota bacterium]
MDTETNTEGAAIHPLEAQRRANRSAIAELGVEPYGERVDGLMALAAARAAYDEGADVAFQETDRARRDAKKSGDPEERWPAFIDDRPVVKVAGRVILHRDNGSLVWMQVRDHTDVGLQIAASKRDVAAPGFKVAKKVDLGDVIWVEGRLGKTQKGEVTVWASSVGMGSKSLAPPPEKWAGLQDQELRYRKRYVDLYANPEAMDVFVARSRIVSAIRGELERRDYLEVETPVLQSQAGGAAARPFITHINALDVDLFLRIAPELYLKRLLVGGMPRVFEFSRNFRNEGVDRSHNPEFTSLEVYQAFGNYETMAELTEGLLRCAATRVVGASGGSSDGTGLVLPFGELSIDYGRAFDRVTFEELFSRALGFEMWDGERARSDAAARGLKTSGESGEPLADVLVVNELFEEVAEPAIDPARPTFVFDYPAALSPLTRPKRDRPELAERWDLFIGGMEIGPAYTELNDPDVQAAKFREQLAGLDDEESTFRTYDTDFVEALKVGMPPAGGMGMGIDRVTMLLTNSVSIRDVVFFPMMRPLEG